MLAASDISTSVPAWPLMLIIAALIVLAIAVYHDVGEQPVRRARLPDDEASRRRMERHARGDLYPASDIKATTRRAPVDGGGA